MGPESKPSGVTGRRLRLVPRVLEPRVTQLRRDLRALVAGLRGERPPTWLARDGSRYASAPGLATREVVVRACLRESASARTLVLEDPNKAPLPSARPGQFYTLIVEHEGESLRRAYSISSDCRERDQVALTVKRVTHGRVSPYLVDGLEPGTRVRVLGPSGEFGCEPDPSRARPRKLVLIAGGSGITPMMAILRTLLPVESEAEVALIYANHSWPEVIFGEAIAELEARHGTRLQVLHTLEHPPPEWSGFVGRATPEVLEDMLAAVPLAGDPEAEFMVCGPAPMMAGAYERLRARGVEESRIHSESFVAPHLQADAKARLRGPQPLTVVVGERETGLVVQPGKTVLEAGLEAGLPMPYSCAMGGCGACKVALEHGEVVMREPNCLGAPERAAGYVLACVANPVQPCRIRIPAASEVGAN